MPAIVLIGAQWGDEGKGKIVDWLSERLGDRVEIAGLVDVNECDEGNFKKGLQWRSRSYAFYPCLLNQAIKGSP